MAMATLPELRAEVQVFRRGKVDGNQKINVVKINTFQFTVIKCIGMFFLDVFNTYRIRIDVLQYVL